MNRRNFIFGLSGMAALAATPASAQVWRKVCLADTLVTDCPVYTPPVTGKGYFGGGADRDDLWDHSVRNRRY